MSRIEKVNELLKQELGRIFLENIEFEPGVMVTVMYAEASDNLETANIWLSIFPKEKEKSALKQLVEQIGEIQGFLNKRLVLRFVPKISFRIDNSEEYVYKIDKVMREVK